MSVWWMPFVLIVIGILGRKAFNRWRMAAQAEFIRHFMLPPGLYEKLRQKRPELSVRDCQLVGQALRQFFLAYLRSGRGFVAMPSQVTDDLWHEFILNTHAYSQFCKRAFGEFLHHTPAAALGAAQSKNKELKRTWWNCCKEENINPLSATRLPLLFAIDTKLNIAGGFRYALDCRGISRSGDNTTPFCASDLSNASAGIDGCFAGEAHGTHNGCAGGHGCSGDGGGGGCGGGGD